jgi:5-methylcytosine-specific restriction endonuclease McrA
MDNGGRCAYGYMGDCNGPLHLDHIIPLSLGGQPTVENTQLLCERHNISKGGRNRLR